MSLFQEQFRLMLNKMSFVTGWGFQQYTSFATCIIMMYRQEPLKETARASDIMSPALPLKNKFLRDVGAPLPALNLVCNALQDKNNYLKSALIVPCASFIVISHAIQVFPRICRICRIRFFIFIFKITKNSILQILWILGNSIRKSSVSQIF